MPPRPTPEAHLDPPAAASFSERFGAWLERAGPEDLEAIHGAARLDREDLEGFEAIGGDRSSYSPLR
ncbi:MAG: hypothetical protein U0165_03630 [Polyangiaceae bacterium]